MQINILKKSVHLSAMADNTSPRAGSASEMKAAFLAKVAKANEPKVRIQNQVQQLRQENWLLLASQGKKERVWTPHADDHYQVQTATKVGGGPPPKKSIADLPWETCFTLQF